MEFDTARVGHWDDGGQFAVEQSRIRDYALATNDKHRLHVTGELAPAVFAVVPAMAAGAGRAVWNVAKSERDGYDTRSLHGEQDLFLHKALIPNDVLTTKAAVIGVHPNSTGTLVITKSESRDASGQVANTQYWTNFIRGVFATESVGERAPLRNLQESFDQEPPYLVRETSVDTDQPARYAAASGDRGIYHLDAQAAREAGLGGIIVHGLCTMAMAGSVVVDAACDSDPRRLKRLAVRFSAPLKPGQSLTTKVWHLGKSDLNERFAFEAFDSAGVKVISQGIAEVANEGE